MSTLTKAKTRGREGMITGEEWRLKLRERRELNEDDDDIVGSSAGVAVARRGFSVVAVVWLVGDLGVERNESFDLSDFLSLRHALEAIVPGSDKGQNSLIGREGGRENVRFISMKKKKKKEGKDWKDKRFSQIKRDIFMAKVKLLIYNI